MSRAAAGLAAALGNPADPGRRDRQADRSRPGDLARIGIDRLAGAAIARSPGWPTEQHLAIYPVSDFQGLAAAWARQDLTVLDVRRSSERAREHIAGSLPVPLHELPGLHGADDPVSPLPAARARYAAAPTAELVSITGGRHDVAHRTVAATVVLFLERLRLGPGLPPIAVREETARAARAGSAHGLVALGKHGWFRLRRFTTASDGTDRQHLDTFGGGSDGQARRPPVRDNRILTGGATRDEP